MKTHSLRKVPGYSWNRYFLDQAVRQLNKKMHDNEEWLLRALLGLNDDAIVFEDVCTINKQGKRGRDCLYLFMTEKDVQTALAAELYIYNRCHVHVEIPIYGKTNKKKRRKGKPFNFRPDLFLLSTRRKERVQTCEGHLEVAAVEIKYFSKWHKPWIQHMIQWDVTKLHQYFRRVSPKVDTGYFLCVDETGLADETLDKIFKQKWLKGRQIGHFVLTPRYIEEHRRYPLELQHYTAGTERCSAYLMDKALGMLKQWCPKSFEGQTVRCDDGDGPWFYIKDGKRFMGWAYFDIYFKHGRKRKPSLIIYLKDKFKHVGNPKVVKWDPEKNAFRFTDSQRAHARRVYFSTAKSFDSSLKKLDAVAGEIFRNVKKVVAKAQR